jgi:FkbH-like protein
VHSLDRTVITAEDLDKTRQYQENTVRDSARREFASLRDYLQSLETRIEIRVATHGLLARVHQLFSKTNQFNLTTRRYTLAELAESANDETSRLIVVRAADRFGDLGWIGALLLRNLGAPAAQIENFVLSCRAMGRGIESAVLNHVKQLCFERSTCNILQAKYQASAKNAPVRELYEQQGFSRSETEVSGCKLYWLPRENVAMAACSWISVEDPLSSEQSSSPGPMDQGPLAARSSVPDAGQRA